MEDSGKGRYTPCNLTSLYWGSLLEALEAANRAEVFGQRATGAPGRHSAPRPIESSSQEVPWHACVLTPAESPPGNLKFSAVFAPGNRGSHSEASNNSSSLVPFCRKTVPSRGWERS